MNIRNRLILMNFLQFFIWGSWLISLGGYLIVKLNFSGTQVGNIYATMGIASVFMPSIIGILADRWINAEKLLGLSHIIGAALLFIAANTTDPSSFYIIMLLNAMVYMPTIALNNSVSYAVLEKEKMDIVKVFPPIRVWGTVGFIFAMWAIDFGKWAVSPFQLYLSASASLVLGVYAFTMPACPPTMTKNATTLASRLGLDALVLLKNSRMVVFLLFSMFLGAALQITNTFGEPFLHDFGKSYPDSFAVNHPSLLMSVSQISETLFILTIPFFLKRFGIKKVMLMSIFAWALRFGFFGIGNPGDGLIFLMLSMIIYGLAFDFFNISGSLFVKSETERSMLASAQGLFMVMTNGIGAFLGGTMSGWVVDHFTTNGIRDWQSIWFTFAGYGLILGVIFPIAFKYKHNNAQAISKTAHS